jgi:hypothetical protein
MTATKLKQAERIGKKINSLSAINTLADSFANSQLRANLPNVVAP